MSFEVWLTVVISGLWLGLVVYLAAGLCDGERVSKPASRTLKDGSRCSALAAALIVGEWIMSALDNALERLKSFVAGVAAQLRAARDTNDDQTGKLAELRAALDAALADDATDKAKISSLQAEVSSLQDEVAARINAAVDALENPPAVEEPVAEEPVAEEPVVVEEPVSDDLVVVEDVAIDDTAGEALSEGDGPVQ